MRKHQSTLTGAAGEHYVMYRLLRQGYIAALAPKGVPNSDLIVTDLEGKTTAVVQVKTKGVKKANDGWQLKEKHEHLIADTLFYCFVDDSLELPVVYVLPSVVVAEVVREAHVTWLACLGKNDRPHEDNDIRWILPDYMRTLKVDNAFTCKHTVGWLEPYKENWALLGLNP